MTQRFKGFLSAQEAQDQAAEIVSPYIASLLPDVAPKLISRIADNLRHVSWQAYQRGRDKGEAAGHKRGLDEITLGGPADNINDKQGS